eukprot:scaffold29144_cov45-Phaeocystis_antarctica.AAC.2
MYRDVVRRHHDASGGGISSRTSPTPTPTPNPHQGENTAADGRTADDIRRLAMRRARREQRP